jgi:hypothetical protein
MLFLTLNYILDSKYLLYSKPYGSLDKSLSPSSLELLAKFAKQFKQLPYISECFSEYASNISEHFTLKRKQQIE